MTKLITRTSVNGATLSGAQQKTANVGLVDALNSAGLQEGNRSTITSTATLALTQCGLVVVDCTSASVTLTLPASGTSADDAVYDFRRIDTSTTNTLTVQRAGADTIDGSTSVTIAAGGTLRMQIPAGSTTWRVSNISGSTAAAARKALAVGEVLLLPPTDYSGVATIDLANVITSAYDLYRVEVYNLVPATNATTLQARVSTDNGASYISSASSYSHARASANPSAVNAAGSNGDTKWDFFSGLSNSTTTPAKLTMWLRAQNGGSGNASMTFSIFGFDGTNVFSQTGGGYSTSANINALRFLMSSGNITARVAVYGSNK